MGGYEYRVTPVGGSVMDLFEGGYSGGELDKAVEAVRSLDAERGQATVEHGQPGARIDLVVWGSMAIEDVLGLQDKARAATGLPVHVELRRYDPNVFPEEAAKAPSPAPESPSAPLPRVSGDSHSMDAGKYRAVVAASGWPERYVKLYLLDEWCWQGEGHQAWLDETNAMDILAVVRPGLADAHADEPQLIVHYSDGSTRHEMVTAEELATATAAARRMVKAGHGEGFIVLYLHGGTHNQGVGTARQFLERVTPGGLHYWHHGCSVEQEEREWAEVQADEAGFCVTLLGAHVYNPNVLLTVERVALIEAVLAQGAARRTA